LRGLGEYAGRDGDGLLGAAGLGVFGWLQDFGAVPVQRHRCGAQRAADLAGGGGALYAVVAVVVVGGEAAEFVPGQLGGLAFPVRGLFFARGAGGRPELQQRARCLGAVQAAVGDDRAVVGALGPAVMGMEVLDELGAGDPQRDCAARILSYVV
jgi:hypothetical protein